MFYNIHVMYSIFYIIRNYFIIFLLSHKNLSRQDRAAIKKNYISEAICRRQRILQAEFFYVTNIMRILIFDIQNILTFLFHLAIFFLVIYWFERNSFVLDDAPVTYSFIRGENLLWIQSKKYIAGLFRKLFTLLFHFYLTVNRKSQEVSKNFRRSLCVTNVHTY